MDLIQRLKCSFRTNADEFYENLSVDQLKAKRRSLKNNYLIIGFMWFNVLLVQLILAKIDFEIIILMTGLITSLLVTLYADYKKRYKKLTGMIKEKS